MGMINTVCGPAGAGKTTFAGISVQEDPGRVRMVPSVTNRAQRQDDLRGEYEYVEWTPEEFEAVKESGFLLWTVNPYGDTCYGTRVDAIREVLESPRAVGLMILVPEKVVELNRYVREHFGEGRVRNVFLYQDDEQVLYDRLMRREGATRDGVRNRIRIDREWHGEVRRLHDSGTVPFTFVNGGLTIEELRHAAREVMPAQLA